MASSGLAKAVMESPRRKLSIAKKPGMAYVGIGVNSGSSLDGLDICCVVFKGNDDQDVWSHQIILGETHPYSEQWQRKLRHASEGSALELAALHCEYGHLIGSAVDEFLRRNQLSGAQFVACHGHTIFHQPDKEFTFQLGDGETIASHLNAVVVDSFRSKDVALGGQGSPIYTLGERHLFGQYNVFLNLGGICTLSCEGKSFEVCPGNLLLNYLACKHDGDMAYDPNGEVAHAGKVIQPLFNKLNSLKYYRMSPPKSLSKDWFDKEVVPILDKELERSPARDLLRTAVEHIAHQVCQAILLHTTEDYTEPVRLEKALLISGGGALNDTLVDALKEKLDAKHLNITFLETDADSMRFKSSVILAFLGLRTLLSLNNMDKSVTGANHSTVCGAIHLPAGGVPINLLESDQYAFCFRRRRSSTTGSLQLPVDDSLPSVSELEISAPIKYHRASWPATKTLQPTPHTAPS